MIDARAVTGDTETTGFGKKDRVIDYAFVDAETSVLLMQTLVSTDAPINPKAQEIHGITRQMLIGKPDMGKSFPSAFNIIGERPVLFWNASFDIRLINQSLEDFGLVWKPNYWCLMEAFKIYGGFDKSPKLENACKMMGVEPGTHRAITDARAAAGVFQAMAEGKIPNRFEIDLPSDYMDFYDR